MKKKIIIVGGGIVGLSTAFFLLKEGHEVLIIEKEKIKEGASFENAGYITPSHIIPLASPGIISKGLRWMLSSSSPFYIKPRINKDLFYWLLKFVKSCNNNHVQRSVNSLKQINEFSRELYQEIYSSKIFDFHLEKKGLLMAFKTLKAERNETKVMSIAKDLGLDVSLISKDQVQSLQPGIEMDIKGAFHYLSDAHSSPWIFMEQLEKYLLENGVKIIRGENVESFIVNNNKVNSILTNSKRYESDYFVLCAGAWSENLMKPLGISLPIQAGKGYCINVEKETGISMPSILIESKVAVTPMIGITRFSGTMEISGINNSIKHNRVLAIASSVSNYYKDFHISKQSQKNVKSALRPLSPDGLPFIGKHSSCKNLIIATGHSMMGWSLGPATGKLVSEIISDKKTSISIDPYRPERVYG